LVNGIGRIKQKVYLSISSARFTLHLLRGLLMVLAKLSGKIEPIAFHSHISGDDASIVRNHCCSFLTKKYMPAPTATSMTR
jgi:hypothetical protein